MIGQIFVYTTEGKYVGCIGAKGEGPEEYAAIDNFQIDEYGNVWVWSLSERKILVYDKFGYVKFSLDAYYLSSDLHMTEDLLIKVYTANLPNARLFKNKLP